jgi:N utilization substance protein B
MLNRRHLRIKVLQALYAYYQSNEESFHKTEKDLLEAVEKIYDLYIYLILTFGELKAHAERRIEDNKSKIRPSEDELNPNLKFVNNSIIQLLDEHKELRVISNSNNPPFKFFICCTLGSQNSTTLLHLAQIIWSC